MVLKLLNRAFSKPASRTRPMLSPPPHKPSVDVYAVFWRNVAEKKPRTVLEVETGKSDQAQGKHKRQRFPGISQEDYVLMSHNCSHDGVANDLHQLPVEWTSYFDCFLAEAVFEHLERPWIAANEISRILSRGAPFLITSHQCFPVHDHPKDFFRFSKEALWQILEDAGLLVQAVEYTDRCLIVPPDEVIPYAALETWNTEFPSYAVVRATGRKPR